MELNKLVFGGLALGCLAAAAGGGYLAARQAPPVAAVVAAPAPGVVDAPVPAGKAVAESEGVITPEAVPVAAPPLEIEIPAPARVAPRRQPAPQPTRTASAPARSAKPAATERPTVARNEPAAPRSEPRESASRSGSGSGPAPSAPSNGGSMWEVRGSVEPERAPDPEPEPEPPPPPAEPEMIDVVVPSDSVLGLQIERTISSETAKVEDRVEARLTRDVRVGDKVAIPAGSIVQGSVMEVERGGKVREKAKLGIRFHTVILADGSKLNIRTDSVIREGQSPSGESAAKIGGAAVGGAILGAILGGGRGAAIGGAVGAAGGTAATMAGDRNPAVLTAGTTVSVRIQQPVTVSVEK